MLEVDLDDARFGKVMDRFRAVAGGDMRPALQLMSVLALQAIDRKFKAQGPGWAPLSPKWAERKRKMGRDGPILVLYGQLWAAMIDPTESAGGIYRETDDARESTLTMGTNLVHAATHQWGRGAIPARPFLPEVEELVEPFRRELEAYLKEQASNA